ncbi:MAG TPA: hypothetical protein VFA18_11525, partial [Gemmataceae bacterium]|nr:hypothetical protein [Gemmataceae bacterium]
AALRQRIQEQRLPDGIEVVQVGRAEHLHPLHLPLPKKPEVELAEHMLRTLHARDGQAEFLSLEALLELTGLHPKATVLNKALAEKHFQEQAIVPLPKVKTGPVGLRKDRERLFSSPALLHLLLQTQRKPTEQVHAVKKLASKLAKQERQPFMEVVNRLLDADRQPAGLGWVWSGKERCLLLLSDLHGRAPVATPASGATPDFPAAFEQAFRLLDRQSGQHNFVKLTDLRRAVPVARTAFDAGLRELRRAGRYSLSAAEGRHGLNTEDKEAGILEDGSLLLYVSKRES